MFTVVCIKESNYIREAHEIRIKIMISSGKIWKGFFLKSLVVDDEENRLTFGSKTYSIAKKAEHKFERMFKTFWFSRRPYRTFLLSKFRRINQFFSCTFLFCSTKELKITNLARICLWHNFVFDYWFYNREIFAIWDFYTTRYCRKLVD